MATKAINFGFSDVGSNSGTYKLRQCFKSEGTEIVFYNVLLEFEDEKTGEEQEQWFTWLPGFSLLTYIDSEPKSSFTMYIPSTVSEHQLEMICIACLNAIRMKGIHSDDDAKRQIIDRVTEFAEILIGERI